jgi:hypothetical protein
MGGDLQPGCLADRLLTGLGLRARTTARRYRRIPAPSHRLCNLLAKNWNNHSGHSDPSGHSTCSCSRSAFWCWCCLCNVGALEDSVESGVSIILSGAVVRRHFNCSPNLCSWWAKWNALLMSWNKLAGVNFGSCYTLVPNGQVVLICRQVICIGLATKHGGSRESYLSSNSEAWGLCAGHWTGCPAKLVSL